MKSKHPLATETRARTAATDYAVDAINAANPRLNRSINSLLARLALGLREAAQIFNQTGSKQVRVEGPSELAAGCSLRITLDDMGYEFLDRKNGKIQILDIGRDATTMVAELHPKLDTAGGIVGWDELSVAPERASLERNVGELTNAYLMATVRKRLQSALH